jgi:hypothetical protein
MGFTLTTVRVGPNQPTKLCAERQGDRALYVNNFGLVPVWLGDVNVAVGVGYRLDPGAPPFFYDQGDELYAIANNGTVALDQRG